MEVGVRRDEKHALEDNSYHPCSATQSFTLSWSLLYLTSCLCTDAEAVMPDAQIPIDLFPSSLRASTH